MNYLYFLFNCYFVLLFVILRRFLNIQICLYMHVISLDEKTCQVKNKIYFIIFMIAMYKTPYVLYYVAPYFILTEHSEVKLRPF